MTIVNAVTYSRTSSEDQGAGFGLPAQVHELRTHAQARGYRITQEFSDEVSGTVLSRPGLDALREAVRRGGIDVVLCMDPDRLSRKLAHQLLLVEELEAKARLEFTTMQHAPTPEGTLMMSVRGAIAEFERLKIRERTLRGKREKARRGLVVDSAPYGYRFAPPTQVGNKLRNSGRLVVQEDESAVVRLIYRLFVEEQRSYRQIVRELRGLGIKPARGRAWGTTQVARILSSDRYTGRVFFTSGGERIACAVPPIISEAQFAAAGLQRAKNRVHLVGRPAHRLYQLRGLLTCGLCGSKFETVPTHGVRNYRCRGRNTLAAQRCRAPIIAAHTSETAVWDALAKALRDPATLRAGVATWAAARQAQDAEVQAELTALTRRLSKTETKVRNLVAALADPDLPRDEIKTQLAALTRERDGLRVQVAEAQARAAAVGGAGARQAAIEAAAARAARGIDRLDPAGRAKVLRALIDTITVGADRSLRIQGILPIDDAAGVSSRTSSRSAIRCTARAWPRTACSTCAIGRTTVSRSSRRTERS